MPFFSIVIPTFNRPEQLQRALNSILKQSFTDYEVLVINNAETAVKLSLEDNRIFFYDEVKKGANSARNKGIALSKAEFICFLDDDDEYLPNHLEVLHKLIVENNSKIAFYKTYARREDKNGKLFDQDDPLKPSTMHNLEYIFRYPLYMNCVCIHKNLLEHDVFNPDIKVAQDYDLWIRILAKCEFFISPVVTNIYHYSGQSTSQPSKEKYYDYIKLYSSYFKNMTYRKFIPKKIRRDRIFKYYFWIMCGYKKELLLKEYIMVLINIIYYKPNIIFERTIYALLLKRQH